MMLLFVKLIMTKFSFSFSSFSFSSFSLLIVFFFLNQMILQMLQLIVCKVNIHARNSAQNGTTVLIFVSFYFILFHLLKQFLSFKKQNEREKEFFKSIVFSSLFCFSFVVSFQFSFVFFH